MQTLVLVFQKIESNYKSKYDTFYSHSKTEIIINESNIDDALESIYTKNTSNIQKSLGKGSYWITDSVINHNINISKYNSLAGSSYIKLPKELDHPRKGLINIQNTDDNECFTWCLSMLIFTIFLLVLLKNYSLIFLIKKSMCFIMKSCNFTWD